MFKINETTYGKNGRIIVNTTTSSLFDQLTIVNIYAPNDHSEQLNFIEEVNNLIVNKKNIILMGDFNAIEDIMKDSLNKRKSLRLNEKKWKKFFFSHDLKEPLYLRKKNNQLTWYSGLKGTRIDRLYSNLNPEVTEIIYLKNIFVNGTDHRCILCELKTKSAAKSKKLKRDGSSMIAYSTIH